MSNKNIRMVVELAIDDEILNEYGLDQSILDELNLKVEEIYV